MTNFETARRSTFKHLRARAKFTRGEIKKSWAHTFGSLVAVFFSLVASIGANLISAGGALEAIKQNGEIIISILATTLVVVGGATMAFRRLTKETPPKFEKSVEEAFLQAIDKTALNPRNESSYAHASSK